MCNNNIKIGSSTPPATSAPPPSYTVSIQQKAYTNGAGASGKPAAPLPGTPGPPVALPTTEPPSYASSMQAKAKAQRGRSMILTYSKCQLNKKVVIFQVILRHRTRRMRTLTALRVTPIHLFSGNTPPRWVESVTTVVVRTAPYRPVREMAATCIQIMGLLLYLQPVNFHKY